MKSLIPWKWGTKGAAPVRHTDWIDRFREDPFGSLVPDTWSGFSSRLPSVDVSESKTEYTVKAEIPGMSEKDIDLSWHEGVLTIKGEKRDEKEEKKKDRYYRECSYGSFCRSIPLGTGVEWDKAKARYKHGILTVTLPKNEKAKKAIEITVA